MTAFCGIYGYEITRPLVGPGFRIEPRTTDYQQSSLWAREESAYHLTAVLSGPSVTDDFLFDLEAVLSFIEHLDVIVTSPRSVETEDVFSAFEPIITTHRRSSGGGAALPSDVFFHNTRTDFVVACLGKLSDEAYCTATKFRALFFKKVETFRQRRPFLEVSYFFLYSGLETYARAVLNDRNSRNSSEPICALLQRFGFDVSVERPNDLPRAVSTYTHLRNSLFHNSELDKSINLNGTTVDITVIDYFFHLSQLVTLVVFKAVEFDDGHINWNSWIDRQPFK
ncbi:hypothetical protein [Noviherbaspirillum sp.]|uniref:hypothetical protein n=1 Tax=Noviherbaspirillum sp. TaxID=1926288 RepID=UPI002FE40839